MQNSDLRMVMWSWVGEGGKPPRRLSAEPKFNLKAIVFISQGAARCACRGQQKPRKSIHTFTLDLILVTEQHRGEGKSWFSALVTQISLK